MRLRPSSYWPLVLAAPLGLLAAALARGAAQLPWLYDEIVLARPEAKAVFLAAGVPQMLLVTAAGAALAAVGLLFVCVAASLVRRYWALWVLHKSYLAVYALIACTVLVVTKITSLFLVGNIALEGRPPTPQSIFFLRWELLWPVLVVLAVTAVLHIFSWRRVVFTLYTGVHDDTPAIGDRIVENLLSNGREPGFRKSVLSSVSAHLLIILVLPWLLGLWQTVKPYRVPKGRGSPTVGGGSGQQAAIPVRVVKAKGARKARQKFVVNPHSAISFHIPDLDESPTGREVEQASELTYAADTTRTISMVAGATGGAGGGSGGGSGGGKGKGKGKGLGAGGGGPGGWPDGMEDSQVRFIRLEYNGPGWDDGMDPMTRADRNFLDEFRELTGFNVARQSESHPIALLRKYKPGYAPPFVYMTGSGAINVSVNDAKILREYLLGGGMLFADCGSPEWDRSFRAFAQVVFPGEPLRVIADDDPIFQVPNPFPNGAPPLWHHGGMRAMGIKHRGRWVVFYHPGDINDAWKTGHSGMDKELAKGAFEMGVNVVYYSFTHYLEETRKYRK